MASPWRPAHSRTLAAADPGPGGRLGLIPARRAAARVTRGAGGWAVRLPRSGSGAVDHVHRRRRLVAVVPPQVQWVVPGLVALGSITELSGQPEGGRQEHADPRDAERRRLGRGR